MPNTLYAVCFRHPDFAVPDLAFVECNSAFDAIMWVQKTLLADRAPSHWSVFVVPKPTGEEMTRRGDCVAHSPNMNPDEVTKQFVEDEDDDDPADYWKKGNPDA